MQWHNKELLIGAATTDTYRLVQRGCTCRWAIIPHVPPTPDQPASPIAFPIRQKYRSAATDESTITENYAATITEPSVRNSTYSRVTGFDGPPPRMGRCESRWFDSEKVRWTTSSRNRWEAMVGLLTM